MNPTIAPARRIAVPLAAALLAIAGACSKEVGNNGESKPSVGTKIDRALDRTQEKLAVAGEKAKQEIAVATEKTQETVSSAVADARESLRQRDAATATTPAASATTTTTTTAVTTGPSTSVTTAGIPQDKRAVLNDAAITASIKADFLKDPDLSVLKIDVDTRDGVVTLNGLADNEPAKSRAEKMAGAVKGVREVHNYLTVKRVS